MSRPWRLLVAGAHVVFALAFVAGLYLYLVGLGPELDLPLAPTAAVAPVDPSSREDRGPTTTRPVVPPVQPPGARTPSPNVPAPPPPPVVSVVPRQAAASTFEAAPPATVASEAVVRIATFVVVDVAPGRGTHARVLPARADPRALVATAHAQRPPKGRT